MGGAASRLGADLDGGRVGVADRDYMKDLYGLLGINRHVSPEELRFAYEQAMGAATRSGDLVRARTLLGAYEAWAQERREGLFGRTFGGSAPQAVLAGSQRRARRAARTRSSRQRKWGMSLPIRVLFLAIVVPGAGLALVGMLIDRPLGVNSGSAWPQGSGEVAADPLPPVTAPDAALYVERVNGRDDVTCTLIGADGLTARFTCQASDGQTWDVHGTPPDNLTAVVTAPSVYVQSARLDAYAAVGAVEDCRRFSGALPDTTGPQTVHATLRCGRGVVTIYLRPEDSLEFIRTGRSGYRVTVVAGNGQTISYDSKTRSYR
jgi:hypothetical protein